MNATSLLVLALAIFGASAAPFTVLSNGCGCGLQGGMNSMTTAGSFGGLNPISALNAVNAVNGISGGLGGGLGGGLAGGISGGAVQALQAPSTFVQTGVVENPTAFVPAIIPSTSVSKSCHCVKTFVRPQVRNEHYVVPSVDRLTRIVTTPIVDVASSGGNLVGNSRTLETVLPGSSGAFGGSFGSSLGGAFGGASSGLLSGSGFGGLSSQGFGGLSSQSFGGLSSQGLSGLISGSNFGGESCGNLF